MAHPIYGAILERGESSYTHLGKVFRAIRDAQRSYNWLISYPDCTARTPEFGALLAREACWMTGEELTEMVRREDFQWIWAVLSGFEKGIPREKVLAYPLPDPESPDLWNIPLALQHPLASLAIAAQDSSQTLLLSGKKELVDAFRSFFPLSGDLAERIEDSEKHKKGGTPLC